jgi:MscS family membrane protein
VLYYIEMMDYNSYLKIKEEINFKIVEIVQQSRGDFAFPTQTVIHQDGTLVQPISPAK